MANLRDRGYGNSMEGYQPKLQLQKINKAEKREPYHSRQKTVAPGEANVSRGRMVNDSARMPSPDEFRAMPQYAPLDLQFTDPKDADDAYRRGAGSYTAMQDAQKQLVPGETRSNLSPEELRKRIRQLEEAMAAMDAGHDKFRLREFKSGDNTPYQAPYLPYTENEEHPAQPLADFNWEKAELLDDAGLGLGVSDAQQQLLWMDYQKAAATGRALKKQHDHYISNHGIPGIENAMDEERQYGNLFQEYNNLRNEYNARLAQYLQGLR